MSFPGKTNVNKLNKFIQAVYEASDVEMLQRIGLRGVRNIIRTESGAFFLTRGTDFVEPYFENLEKSRFADYKAHYEKLDEYKKKVFSRRIIPLVDRSSDYMEYGQWEKNEHRVDFLLAQSIYHIACAQVFDDGKLVGEISLHRSKAQGDFQNWEMKMLKTAGRHLSQAFMNMRLIREVKILKSGLEQVCDIFAEPLLVFNERFEPVYINYTARELVGGSSIQQSAAGVVDDLKRCCREVAGYMKTGQEFMTWACSMVVNTLTGRRLFHVFARKDIQNGAPVFVAVCPNTAGNRSRLNSAVLDILSAREKEITMLLVRGRSNEEIATELFVSINTIKTHVRNIFLKTGVGSRAELASKLFI